MWRLTLNALPGDQLEMIALEYEDTVEYEMGYVITVCGGTSDVVEMFCSRPFLSQAVHMVGVLDNVMALDPLRPLMRA